MTNPHDLELLLRQSRWVRALALDVLGDPQGADDVTQDTLMAAVRHGVAHSDEPRLRAWLRRVARNFALASRRSAARRKRRETAAARPESLPSAAEALERVALQRKIADAVRALPSPEKEIVALRYFDDCTPREIARRLGMSPNAVSTRLSRARVRLRSALDGDDPDSRAHWALVAAGWPRAHSLELGAASTSLIPAGLIAMNKSIFAVAALVVALLIGAVLRWNVSITPDEGPPPESATVARLAQIEGRAEITQDPLAPDESSTRAPIAAPPPGAAAADDAAIVPPEPTAEVGAIEVHVTRADTGDPVPGVGMSLFVYESGRSWNIPGRAVTDPRGQATFSAVPPGDARIYMERLTEENTFGSEFVSVVRGETSVVAVTVAPGTTLRGTVVDYVGRPVAGADIWLGTGASAPFDGQIVTHSDRDGEFEILHAAPSQGLAARAVGFAPSTALMPLFGELINGARVVELVLPALGGTIEGFVLDAAGAPVPNALVVIGNSEMGHSYLVDGTPTYDAPQLVMRTTVDGTFRTELMGSGDIQVRARAGGTCIAESVVLVPEGGVGSVELVLEPAARVVGRVETDAGAPVAGATIRVMSSLDPLIRASVRSRADGSFELPAVRAGSVELEVETDARQTVGAVLETRAGQTTEWNVILPPMARLAGRVVAEDGTPLVGWRVRRQAEGDLANAPMSVAAVTTDRNGEFLMEPCLDAPHTLTVTAPGQLMAEHVAQRFSVSPADAEVELVVRTSLLPSSGFTGRLVDSDGAPIRGHVNVEAMTPILVHLTRMVHADGTFDIRYLPPGEFRIEIVAAGYTSARPLAGESLAEGEVRNLGSIVLTPK